MKLLYRGISSAKYARDNCKIFPYRILSPFESEIFFDQHRELTFDIGLTLDSSVENAVVTHQIDSSAFPSSGISTTPHYERAKYYALHCSREGVIIVINRDILQNHGIAEHVVANYTQYPKVPEDAEVILDLSNHSELPAGVILQIETVRQ